ncbi:MULTISPECIES: aliphatic sulfonate ABC transporter substrate-binding protein [Cryobacterium]|uniref:Putative aliphatic sulfonates-binding protein n=1 Tax=Cryobacterium zongtaii TaxID=1259217 RepID=A0A2S3ZCC4_9MICO|nr:MULTISPECIES: aliphatic sulfonate ABC transporter substrate-binding protein [Cryobacterium]MEC5183359.1 sulfonate transport system substrate-binding protein [Cryobacterium sp. MP_3.1]POH63465.1 aliphatic sulfonates ABC transporter substrate-binding protein [Cryobacterium zongtaii]POH63881.1 aliphatic sulfonates ABC transporter substrate-binding protein [Cryobacterium zongtaii]TFC42199.1 aliphatic sulfonate ABC transporter substrate-binding protein [Cryobacterium sp. TMN-39-2]TFC56853.1 alip
MKKRFTATALIASAAAAALLLTGCVAGENQPAAEAAVSTDDDAGIVTQGGELNIDFATYNPLSLVIKEKGWLEEALADQEITVNWVQSAGSNKANEALRANAIDVGSTAGSAALLHRSNGSPIQVIDIYSQPEWAALVVPDGSEITSVADLKGKQIAATQGTDPYFFLLQALEEAGLGLDDVTVQNLQHADGWAALQNGSVDAWAGLDPIMAGAEAAGAELIYRNVDFNSYGFLNATEAFITEKPDVAQTVVDVYEHARAWALANEEETAQILADVAGLDLAVATKVITERSNLDVDNVPGDAQIDVLTTIGPIFVETGDVLEQSQVDDALDSIVNDTFATKADPTIIE